MRQHIGNGLAILAGQVVYALVSLIGVRILTEYLSPAEYGNLALGLTLAVIVNQLLMVPLGAGIARFYSVAKEKKESIEFLAAMLKLLFVVISVVVFIALLAFTILWATNIEGWFVMVSIAAIFSIVSGINAVINGLWLGDNQQIALSLNQGLEPTLRIAGGVAAIILIKDSGEAAFGGYILGVVVLLLSQFYWLKRFHLLSGMFNHFTLLGDSSVVKVWHTKTFYYSSPFAIWGVFVSLHMASDRWVLQWYHGAEEVGYFAVLYQIGYVPMTLLTSMATQLLTPILFGMAGDGRDQSRLHKVGSLTHKAIIVALLFMFFAVAASWILSDTVFFILTPADYQHLHSYLPLFVIAGGLFGAGQVAVLQIQSQYRTNELLKIKFVAAIIGVTANFSLIPFYGVMGLGISLTIFALTYLLWLLIDAYKASRSLVSGQI